MESNAQNRTRQSFGIDNAFAQVDKAMFSLFVLSSGENYPEVMYVVQCFASVRTKKRDSKDGGASFAAPGPRTNTQDRRVRRFPLEFNLLHRILLVRFRLAAGNAASTNCPLSSGACMARLSLPYMFVWSDEQFPVVLQGYADILSRRYERSLPNTVYKMFLVHHLQLSVLQLILLLLIHRCRSYCLNRLELNESA